ncbi:hypothetical protein ACWCQW_31250 [Streptomyces mirabilis]
MEKLRVSRTGAGAPTGLRVILGAEFPAATGGDVTVFGTAAASTSSVPYYATVGATKPRRPTLTRLDRPHEESLTDDAGAHHLGVPARTVRCEMARLLTVLDARSLFQAGVLAVWRGCSPRFAEWRRGLFDCPWWTVEQPLSFPGLAFVASRLSRG